MKNEYKLTKYACYCTNLSMSVVSNISPILFLTFNSLYGISFSKLGLLVLLNFLTQLIIDLIFSFFSHKFNLEKTTRIIPFFTSAGILIYALWPYIFPKSVYTGLMIGTVIFAFSGGLVEILLSPLIAAIPSDNPDREISRLHSVYAWGVVGMIILSTIFLSLFGSKNWQLMALCFSVIPLFASALFIKAKIPNLNPAENSEPTKASKLKDSSERKALILCVVAIILGGAAECTMAQWCSGYIEKALGIEKAFGDLFGTAIFALTLGLGRTLYSKYGKNITRVILFGAFGASACYLIAALTASPIVGLTACALTGLCVSMFWPGCLLVSANMIPSGGVFVYAMMASGGDLGASLGPQMIGIITDKISLLPKAIEMSKLLGISPEQLGMKAGMIIASLFPILAIPLYYYLHKHKRENLQ